MSTTDSSTGVEDRGPQLTAVCITFITLATVSVSLRAYVRLCILKVFGVEDAFMIAAWLCFLMFVTAALGGVHWGTGRHAWNLTPIDEFMALRYWWVCYIGYTTTMIAVKLSVGLTLLRLTVHNIHRRILYTIMSVSVITGTAFFFLTVFQCSPVPYFWTRALGESGSCIQIDIIEGITYGYSAVNTVTDFTFGLLPVFMVMGLNMDRKTKIMLIPILGMACIASAAILVRMAYVHEFADADFLYGTTDIAIWSCTEQGLAITAGSLATLRPLLRLISEKLGLSQTASRNNPTPQPLVSPRRISKPFGVLSYRSNDPLDAYHRMDDLISAKSSMGNVSDKQRQMDLEQGGNGVSWSTVTSPGEERGRKDSEGQMDPGKVGRLQIEKRIEIETRVDPAYD